MAKTFFSIKNTSLQLTDKMPFGKFKDCRLCDIVETDWAYILWLSKATKVNFSKSVLDAAKFCQQAAEAKRHYEEEVKPYLHGNNPDTAVIIDDVPF